MNLKEEQKILLRNKPRQEKMLLLNQKLKFHQTVVKNEASSKTKFRNVSDYASYLKESSSAVNQKELLECVKSLRIELQCKPVSWVRKFGEQDGHKQLFNIVRVCSYLRHDKKPETLILECISCIKGFMNNSQGFSMILEQEELFVILVMALDLKHPNIMIKILEILSAVTLVAKGGEKVVNAFTDAAHETGHDQRFWIFVEALKKYKDNTALAVAGIQLLNCLITNNDEFDFRFHLRCELYRTTDSTNSTAFRNIAMEMDKL